MGCEWTQRGDVGSGLRFVLGGSSASDDRLFVVALPTFVTHGADQSQGLACLLVPWVTTTSAGTTALPSTRRLLVSDSTSKLCGSEETDVRPAVAGRCAVDALVYGPSINFR